MPHSESLSKSDNFVSMSSTLQKENTAASVYTGETMSQMAATSEEDGVACLVWQQGIVNLTNRLLLVRAMN